MRLSIRGMLLLVFLGWMCAARAETPILELIPANAPLGIGIRNLDDLQKKGDKLVQDTGWQAPMRPSEVCAQLYDFLGVRNGLDTKGSAAVMFANPTEAGIATNWNGIDVLELVVVAIPVADADKMAANFGIAEGKLQPDTIVPGRARASASSSTGGASMSSWETTRRR
jgi:hypothetical protein